MNSGGGFGMFLALFCFFIGISPFFLFCKELVLSMSLNTGNMKYFHIDFIGLPTKL